MIIHSNAALSKLLLKWLCSVLE